MSVGEPLYAVLDPGRDPAIWPALTSMAPDASCLFAGPISDGLRRVSPHLISLPEDSNVLAWWRAKGRGKAWGIAFRSTTDIDKVRRHLKKFMFAFLPDESRVLFRFWDPNILSLYLSMCSDEACEAFFGPFSILYAEDWKSGRNVSHHRKRPSSLYARPSLFIHPDTIQITRMAEVSFMLRVRDIAVARAVNPHFRQFLSQRADVLSLWESCWSLINGQPACVAAPALSYAVALHLQGEDVSTRLSAMLTNEDAAFLMQAALADGGYLPFTTFSTEEFA